MKFRNWLPVTVLALATSTVVNSQETAEVVKRSANRMLEEVVVTAQKRQERIQDVPISIQAFSQEKMEAMGIQSIQDIQLATPGFTVTNAAGFNITFLRGVGSDAFLPGVDSSVPFYVDSVPLLAAQGTSDTLGRVERIEVLKGPQGTLFGRNATGGAISIVTPDPDQEFYGDLKLEGGNYDMYGGTGFVNVPVTDAIAFNLAVFHNRRDQYLTNASTGRLPPYLESKGQRLKVRFDFTDTLSFTMHGSKQFVTSNCALAFQNVKPAIILGGDAAVGKDEKFDRTVTLDGDAGCENESYIWGGTLEWEAEYFTSKLITARQRAIAHRVDGPFDGTALPVADAHGGTQSEFGSRNSINQDTAELQFLSNENTPYSQYMEWAVGMFYLRSKGGFDPIVFNVAPDILNELLPSSVGNVLTNPLNDILASLNLPPILGQTGIQLANSGLIRSESFSVYAQPTFHLSDALDLTTGVRYQAEDRDLDDSHTSFLLEDGSEVVLPLPQGELPQLTPEQVSVRLALQWRPFDDDTQFYVSWARGWKNPTYNTVNLLGDIFGTMVPLKAERVDTTELGVKTKLFDDMLTLNTAVFYTEQKNPLSSNVSIPSGGVANFTNAGGARITGVDGDFLLLPFQEWNPGFVITGAFAYIDAHYTDFKNGRGYDDDTGLGFGNGGANLPARDLSGKRIPRVPKFEYNLGVSQRLDFNMDHALEIGADMSYSSGFYFLTQESELSKRDELYLANARMSYFYTPWDIEVTAFINNIEDKTYVDNSFVTDFGSALLANDNVRLYGLRLKWTYQ
jgi:iron complex outermembrane receptor protein